MDADPIYTMAAHDDLVEGIRRGLSRSGAAKWAGIPPASFRRWLSSGESGSGPYVQLWQAVARIEADLEAELVAGEIAAARGGTKQAQSARQFMLTRRHGWSQRQEITGADGGPVETVSIDLAKMSAPEMRRMLEQVAYQDEG